jgi:putative colanic acid biosynthesis acetyltransferase WcaF
MIGSNEHEKLNMKQVNLSLYKPSRLLMKKNVVTAVIWELLNISIFMNRLFIWNSPKRTVLRLFGAEIGKGVVIKQGVNIKYPWKLKIGDHSWIGEGVWIDNIEWVEIGSSVCISQGAYLCTGNHDWSKPDFPLIAKPIHAGDGVWVGAKSIIGPGIRLGERSVVTAGSVVTRDTEPDKIYQGNPAVCVKERRIE